MVREVERKTGETKVEVQTRTVTVEKLVYRDRTQVVATPLPKWSAGGNVGLGLDGRARYGGEVGRRLFGNLWFTVGADIPTPAARLGLRLEF